MRLNDDGKTVAAADCLVPGIGEIIGGSQREERIELLEKRIRELGMNPEDYWWYCDLRRYGSCRHAGFGLGFERMVMYLTGIGNIRDVELHPRTVGNADFNSSKNKGHGNRVPCFFENYTPLRALPPKGRLRHARSEKSFLARACRAKKRFEIISRLRMRKAVTLSLFVVNSYKWEQKRQRCSQKK